MNIYMGDKLEIEYDSYERIYRFALYDKYGHYVDTINFDREEMKDLYESLEKLKNDF